MLGEGMGRAEVPSDLAPGDPGFGAPRRTLSLVLEGNLQFKWHWMAAETQQCRNLPQYLVRLWEGRKPGFLATEWLWSSLGLWEAFLGGWAKVAGLLGGQQGMWKL